MKRTIITILITAVATSVCWFVLMSLRRGVDGLWLMSAVKAPVRMALEDIEADLQAGRQEIALAKVAALRRQWTQFENEDGFKGNAIGNIMVLFRQIDNTADAKLAEPGNAGNWNQPTVSEIK